MSHKHRLGVEFAATRLGSSRYRVRAKQNVLSKIVFQSLLYRSGEQYQSGNFRRSRYGQQQMEVRYTVVYYIKLNIIMYSR